MLRPRLAIAFLALAGVLSWVPAARSGDARLLPSDTEVVITLNLKQLMESELVKSQKDLVAKIRNDIEGKIPADNDGLKLLKKLGFDPVKDLHSITIAHPGTKDPRAGLIVIEGHFDATKFASTAEEVAKDKAEHLKITKSGTMTLYEITTKENEKAYATLQGGSLLLVSMSPETLTGTVARLSGGGKAELKTQVKDMLQTVNDKQTFNFLITAKALRTIAENAPIPNGDQINQGLQGIEGVNGAITVTKDIQFQFGVGSKDEATAKKLVAAGNGTLLFARTMAAQQAQMDPKIAPLVNVLDTVQLSAMGTNTVLRGVMSFANLEKLLKNINNQDQ